MLAYVVPQGESGVLLRIHLNACIANHFPQTDKQGRPINVHFFGGMDVQKLYKVCSPEHHWESFLVNCELVGHVHQSYLAPKYTS